MISTSISQSQRLLEAGIDPQTADMMWEQHFVGQPPFLTVPPKTTLGRSHVAHAIRAWSLSALILILPEHTFYRIARARGNDIEEIFEDCVTYLCKEK